MLQFEILDERGYPLILRGSRLLVRHVGTGTVVAATVELGSGIIESIVAKDKSFSDQLRQLGIQESVQVTTVDKDLRRIHL